MACSTIIHAWEGGCYSNYSMFRNTSSAETGQCSEVEAERNERNIRVHLCTMDYVGRAAILGAHGGG